MPNEPTLVELPPPEQEFGFALRRARLAAGLTQKELEERTEALGEGKRVTQNLISAYELGKTQRPTTPHILALEDALGLSRGALWELAGMPRMAKQLRAATLAPAGALIVTDATPDQRKAIKAILRGDPPTVRHVLAYLRDRLNREGSQTEKKIAKAQNAIRDRHLSEQEDAG